MNVKTLRAHCSLDALGIARTVATASLLLSASWPANAAFTLETAATGLTNSIYATSPEGDSRLFIVERAGAIKILQNGTVTSFLDLTSQVSCCTGERGMGGMVFDPNFATNNRFYVNYIDKISLNTVVASYIATGNTAVFEKNIITIQQDFDSLHKGGWMGFQPGDVNNLYVSVGDGGPQNDALNHAQDKSALQGKILRLNINGDDFPTDANLNYSIAPDNPFVGQAGARGEIWAYGLRNPSRASFDRLTGDLWIGDVGQDAREEVDFQAADAAGGANYGWRLREGNIQTPRPDGCTPGTACDIGGPIPADYVGPIYDYIHDNAGNEAVIGGYVYRGSQIPELYGSYIFGDFTSGKIWSFERLSDGTITSFTDISALLGNPLSRFTFVSFAEDGLGELYLIQYRDSNGPNGRILALVPVPEPSTFVLMGVALVALGLHARRRARA